MVVVVVASGLGRVAGGRPRLDIISDATTPLVAPCSLLLLIGSVVLCGISWRSLGLASLTVALLLLELLAGDAGCRLIPCSTTSKADARRGSSRVGSEGGGVRIIGSWTRCMTCRRPSGRPRVCGTRRCGGLAEVAVPLDGISRAR